MPIIEVEGLCKSFGVIQALDHVDLRVDPGEFVAITGPSGSGKSTLLHLLAALDIPDSGRIAVCGREMRHHHHNLTRYRRYDVGLVFQLHTLLAHLDARRNVEIPMMGTHRSGRERRQRAMELLAELQLEGKERHRPPELSGGERQRVAIARALANDPAVLLADEPTGSLDSVSVEHVLGLLQQLRASRSVTIVVITHDPHVAAAADRTITMRDGRFDA